LHRWAFFSEYVHLAAVFQGIYPQVSARKCSTVEQNIAWEDQMPFCVRLVAALCTAVLLALSPAHAQDYPTREIHSIVNFPPGTGMDIMNRW
jgi:hypothetical protein